MIKTSVLLVFIFFAIGTFGQSNKLIKSFKLSTVAYTLYESYKPSKINNDTTFYLLYRVGKPKMIARETKTIIKKNDGDTLAWSTFKINKNSVVFYQYAANNKLYHRIYTQNKNGLLSFKSKLMPPAIIAEPPKVFKDSYNDSGCAIPVVDVLPEFPGGMTALRSFLARNIEYPDEASEAGIQGNVYAKFIVTKDGSVTNIEIERSLGYGCDQEVIRVLKRMPKWTPARLNGKQVKYLFRIPVHFALAD